MHAGRGCAEHQIKIDLYPRLCHQTNFMIQQIQLALINIVCRIGIDIGNCRIAVLSQQVFIDRDIDDRMSHAQFLRIGKKLNLQSLFGGIRRIVLRRSCNKFGIINVMRSGDDIIGTIRILSGNQKFGI